MSPPIARVGGQRDPVKPGPHRLSENSPVLAIKDRHVVPRCGDHLQRITDDLPQPPDDRVFVVSLAIEPGPEQDGPTPDGLKVITAGRSVVRSEQPERSPSAAHHFAKEAELRFGAAPDQPTEGVRQADSRPANESPDFPVLRGDREPGDIPQRFR